MALGKTLDKKHHTIIIIGLVVLVILSSAILYIVYKINKSSSKEQFALADFSCGVGYDGMLLPACEGGSDSDRLKCYETCINLYDRNASGGHCKETLRANSNVMARYNMYGQQVHGPGWIEVSATPCEEMGGYDY
jgi:hypothetical protein